MTRFSILTFTFILLLAVVFSHCTTRDYFSDQDVSEKASEYIEYYMHHNGLPGASFSIVKQGEMLYSGSWGTMNIQRPASKVQSSTVFHLASVSKPIVATEIMRLHQNGLIDINDPVVNHLDYFQLKDPTYKDITIKHLLNHTSGIADIGDDWWLNDNTSGTALEENTRSLRSQELIHSPGQRWSYCNINYDILGDLLAKVSGYPFEEYMSTKVFVPLDMRNSSYYYDSIPQIEHAQPHSGMFQINLNHIKPYSRAHAPSSTLQSSVDDMAKWMIAILSKDNKFTLSDEIYSIMWEGEIDVDGQTEMGLGWFVFDHRGNKVVGHGGRDPGFSSVLALVPEREVGFIFMTNNASSVSTTSQIQMIRDILDIGAGKEIDAPPVSVSYPVAEKLAQTDIDQAIEEYYRLKNERNSIYQTGMAELTWLANDLYEQERYDEALKLYEVERKEYPDYCHVCLMIAYTYNKLGKKEEARQYYSDWLVYLPDQTNEEFEKEIQFEAN